MVQPVPDSPTMTRRALARGLGLLAASAPLARPVRAQAPAGRKVTARLAHFFPTTTPFQTAALKLAEVAAQRSGGALEIQVFPAGQLGDDKAQFEQVRLGSIQLAIGSAGIIAQTVPTYDVFDAPFLFDDERHFARVIRSPLREELSERLIKAAGVRTPALGFGGFRNLFTRRPVGTLAELKGLKIRTPEIPVYVETFRALGASPTPLPYLEVYLALQQGTIDGAENPLSSGSDQKWHEVAKFVSLTRHQGTGQSYQVNNRWYLGLPADLQKAVDEACLAASELQGGLVVERDARYEGILRQAGVTIAPMDPAPLRRAVAELPKKFESRWGAGVYEKIRAMA